MAQALPSKSSLIVLESVIAAVRAGSRDFGAGADAQAITVLDRLGIAGYGFAPLRLPPDLDFAALFHGVDERVPIDAVRFGTRVLRRLLEDC